MKKGILLFMGCLVWLTLIFTAHTSHASSFSNSTAWIDWNTLSIWGIDIQWDYQESYSYAEAQDPWDSPWNEDFKDYWGETSSLASVTNANGGANGTAWTNDSQLFEEVSATSTGGDYWAGSLAKAELYGEFTALETGELTISVDYYLTQDLQTENMGESAWGDSETWLEIWKDNYVDDSYDEHFLWNEVYDGESGSWNDSGTLEVTLFFNEGDAGYFSAGVMNWAEARVSSPVPEPSTMLLLGVGLIGLVGCRHKQSKKA